MNKKGLICENTVNAMVAVREQDLEMLLVCLGSTLDMLDDLITLWQKEERLKQHHRPYLDVRKEMAQKCEAYLSTIAEIETAVALIPDGCTLESNSPSGDDMSMLDDLLTLVEYLEVLHHFLKLLGYGVPVKDAASESYLSMMDDVDKMLDRWEKQMQIQE